MGEYGYDTSGWKSAGFLSEYSYLQYLIEETEGIPPAPAVTVPTVSTIRYEAEPVDYIEVYQPAPAAVIPTVEVNIPIIEVSVPVASADADTGFFNIGGGAAAPQKGQKGDKPMSFKGVWIDSYTYKVGSGDTLSSIGAGVGHSWQSIYDANRGAISDPNLIYPGQVLNMPWKPAAPKNGETGITTPTTTTVQQPVSYVKSDPVIVPANSGTNSLIGGISAGDNGRSGGDPQFRTDMIPSHVTWDQRKDDPNYGLDQNAIDILTPIRARDAAVSGGLFGTGVAEAGMMPSPSQVWDGMKGIVSGTGQMVGATAGVIGAAGQAGQAAAGILGNESFQRVLIMAIPWILVIGIIKATSKIFRFRFKAGPIGIG